MINELIEAIKLFSKDKQMEYEKWFEKFAKTLKNKVNQKQNNNKLPAFKRGDIVYIDFGKNVGDEFEDNHFAIVIRTSNKSDDLINVIPLTSKKENKIIHWTEIVLAPHLSINYKTPVCKVTQMRPLSKKRLVKYKDNFIVGKIKNGELDIIDRKILEIYIKPLEK